MSRTDPSKHPQHDGKRSGNITTDLDSFKNANDVMITKMTSSLRADVIDIIHCTTKTIRSMFDSPIYYFFI